MFDVLIKKTNTKFIFLASFYGKKN